MIFEEIYSALSGESTITDLVGSNIFFEHLPMNFKVSDDCLVYFGNVQEAQHTTQLENFGDYTGSEGLF